MERSIFADRSDDRPDLKVLASIAAANIVAFGIFAAVQLQPRTGEPVAAWFPAGDGAAITGVAQAGGGVLSAGPVPGVIQARSGDPAFARGLRKAGAFLVVASPAGAGCAPDVQSAS